STTPNGTQNFDYRVVSSDVAHSDPGDLVASSIQLMSRMPRESRQRGSGYSPAGGHATGSYPAGRPPRQPAPPGAIAVAYRDREQAVAIRAAIGRQRRDAQLLPESTAALTYLRHTGLLDRYRTVALVDLGATGMTVTVAEIADDTVLRSERTDTISGAAIDEAIYHHLLNCHTSRRGTRPNRNTLVNRSRAAKEHLSIAPAVTIDHIAGQPLKLTRADFGELISDLLRDAAIFVSGVFARAPQLPEAVAMIGGGANIVSVVRGLDHRLEIPVMSVPEPEAVTAKGAALVADSAQPSAFAPTARGDGSTRTFTKLVGTLAGAVVVVGLMAGYGVKELSSITHDEVAPAGTTQTPTSTTPMPGGPAPTGDRTPAATVPPQPDTSTAQPTTSEQPTTTTSTSAPVLRPDPNLPRIPLPSTPRQNAPLVTTTTPKPAPSHTTTTTPTPPLPKPLFAPGTSTIPLPPPHSGSAG
ncbi:MAG: Hsp70 family protein, partial [Nocardia sp.]|nr:Hsp70 family protein [Nocardia sp.]